MNINELHRRALSGGKPEEDELFKKLYESFLYILEQRVWNAQDAEEITQDILVTVSARYKEINFEKSFVAWVHKVMENKLLHYYRSKGRQNRKIEKTLELARLRENYKPEPELTRKLLACLNKISRMNNRYARILNLNYLGYSTDEICGKLGITRNNAFIILYRARSMLKHCLKYGETK